MPTMRINRALAAAGVASRRGAEELVRAGRVRVNGQLVTDLATQINPLSDKLSVDGKPVELNAPVYYLFHKPRGMIATAKDELGRPCVGDVCGGLAGHPQPVGRLDRPSEGLMLLTNDGSVALRLTHPRYGVTKEYQVTVEPRLTQRDAKRLLEGVELEDGPARLVEMRLRGEDSTLSRLAVVVAEGRFHLVRRIFAALGYEVTRLKRVRLGCLSLDKLPLGETRPLSTTEVRELKRALKLEPAATARERKTATVAGADKPVTATETVNDTGAKKYPGLRSRGRRSRLDQPDMQQASGSRRNRGR